MEGDRYDERSPDPGMDVPPAPDAQARQVSPGQQGLKEQQRQRGNSGEAPGDVNRIAPGEQRASRRQDARHCNGYGDNGPDQT